MPDTSYVMIMVMHVAAVAAASFAVAMCVGRFHMTGWSGERPEEIDDIVCLRSLLDSGGKTQNYGSRAEHNKVLSD